MQQPSLTRIIAAIELNPDRPRVTLRRDDVRALLADHQRQAADVEHYKTGCVRLEQMCAQHFATTAAQQAEEQQLRTQLQRLAAEHSLCGTKSPTTLSPFDIGVILTLYPLILAAGVLLGHR